METATTPTDGRPQIHPSWIEGEPMFLSEAFPAGNERRSWPRWLAWAAIVTVAAGTVVAVYAMPARGQEMPPVYDMVMTQLLGLCANGKRGPREEFAGVLLKRHGERHAGTVYLTPEAIAEKFTNPARGTWTIIRTDPHAISCIIAAGKYRPGAEQSAL